MTGSDALRTADTFDRGEAPSLTPLDEQFLCIETKAQPMHWAVVIELDSISNLLSFDELKRRVLERAHAVSRFNISISRGVFRRPRAEYVMDWDFSDNVSEAIYDSERAAMDWLSILMSRRLTRGRPLWHVTLITVRKPQKQYIVLRGHHCMADAIAAGGFAALLVDDDTGDLSQFKRFLGTDNHRVHPVDRPTAKRALTGFARSWADTRKDPRLPRISKTGDRDIHLISMSTQDLRARARAVSATTFELFCAAIGIALTRCPPVEGTKYSGIRVSVPVTLDPELRHVGNAVSFALVNIRGDTTDMTAQISTVREQMRRVAQDRTELASFILSQGKALPWMVERAVTKGYIATVRPDVDLGLNPAFSRADSVLGRKISTVYPIGPLLGCPIAVSGLILGDVVSFGFTFDRSTLGGFGETFSAQVRHILTTAGTSSNKVSSTLRR